MKFTTIVTTVAFAAYGAQALVVAEAAQHQEDKRNWCRWRGQSCWKVKRAADAFSLAVRSSADLSARDASDPAYLAARDLSNSPGGAAYNAKRAIDALAATIASTQEDPDSFYESLLLHDLFFPDTEEGDDAAAPAEPAADAPAKTEKRDLDADKRWCNEQGQTCWAAKRAATALASTIAGFEAEAKRSVEGEDSLAKRNWCRWRGQSCWKRDVAEDEEFLTKRNWCRWRGQSCWKRDVAFEPLATLAARDIAMSPVDGGDKAKRNWCRWRGQSCWKRDEVSGLEARCHGPAGECTKAQRDLQAIQLAARDVLASLE